MKKFILFFLCTVLSALPLSAQMTARQVLEKTMDVLNKEKGYSADLQIKALGLKFQVALAVRGQQSLFKTDEGDMYVNGTTITYSNIKTNIPAQLVAYNAQKYPGATIVDKR